MSEWWTYRLSDFLMFSPRTYGRLIEAYNAAYWPAQVVVLVVAVGVLWKMPRAAGVLFALAWAHVGWAFFAQRYADIFPASVYLAAACGVQAIMMLAAGRAGNPWPVIVALVAYPALSVLALDRSWAQAEFFGFMPDPTAVATLAFAATLQRPAWSKFLVCVIPAVILLLGWGTLMNLHGV